MRKTLHTLLAGLLGLGLLWPAHVAAYYSIDPLRLEVQAPESGRVATASIRVTNNGSDPVRLKVYMQDWTVNENGGLVILKDPLPDSMISYTRFNPKEFEISPNSTQVLRMAIAFPEGTPNGEYHSMIFFEDLKPTVQRLAPSGGYHTSLEVKQRFGSAIYVYKGKLKSKPVLDKFECSMAQEKAKASIVLNNEGERHARLAATVVVMQEDASSGKWKPYREVSIRNLQDIVVMPHQKYAIEQVLAPLADTEPFPPGKYQLTLHVMSRNDSSADKLKSSVEFVVPQPERAEAPISEAPEEPPSTQTEAQALTPKPEAKADATAKETSTEPQKKN